ncbi:hypothetical protein [Cloacibacterium sp.]
MARASCSCPHYQFLLIFYFCKHKRNDCFSLFLIL